VIELAIWLSAYGLLSGVAGFGVACYAAVKAARARQETRVLRAVVAEIGKAEAIVRRATRDGTG